MQLTFIRPEVDTNFYLYYASEAEISLHVRPEVDTMYYDSEVEISLNVNK